MQLTGLQRSASLAAAGNSRRLAPAAASAGPRQSVAAAPPHATRPATATAAGSGAGDRVAAATQLHRPRTSSSVVCFSAAAAGGPLAAAQPGVTTLGFVGIGIMGLPMAHNLLKAGYNLVVFNRSPDKCEPLKAAGAQVAGSAADVARQADITFAMLADPAAALEVATGPDGIVAGLSPGKGYVDVSTIDPASSAAIAVAVKATGALHLEAPVSGSKGPAEQGTLIFLTAGDEELYKAAAGPLEVMGKASFFLGPVGKGAEMKLVVNAVMGAMMAAFAEGLSLAEQLGLSKQDVIDVVGLGAIAAPMFALKGPAMAKGSYPPAFPLKHQQKDLRLALAEADAAGQPLAVIGAANDLYIRARAAGHGEADFSAVLEAVVAQQSAGGGGQEQR